MNAPAIEVRCQKVYSLVTELHDVPIYIGAPKYWEPTILGAAARQDLPEKRIVFNNNSLFLSTKTVKIRSLSNLKRYFIVETLKFDRILYTYLATDKMGINNFFKVILM